MKRIELYEYIGCLDESRKVDFLTEPWEKHRYAVALAHAVLWGKKIDERNHRENEVKRLRNRYN